MADTGEIQKSMRDIQLICVGYGLHKECRKQLLGELPQGICCHEVEELLRCFRTGPGCRPTSSVSDSLYEIQGPGIKAKCLKSCPDLGIMGRDENRSNPTL